MFDLKEVATLAQSYKDAGLGHTWNAGFLANVAAEGKQPRGRGVEIMKDLLHKGPPESWPTWLKAKEYLRVAETCTVPAEAQTLRDFAGQVFSGRELSERQKAYAEKLMAGADRVVETVEITEELRAFLWALEMKMNNTSSWYWGQKPATYNRLRSILSGIGSNVSKTTISKEDLEYARGNFKGFVALWEKTPEYYGTLCKVHTSHAGGKLGTDGQMVDILVIGNRTGDGYGRIIVDCLVEGAVKKVDMEKISFPRKPRKKKSATV